MTTLKASETRIPPEAFNQVAYQQARIRIERRGGRPVYLISAEDMAILEEFEDQMLARDGKQRLTDFTQSGVKAIPWKKTRIKAGL